MSSCVAKARAVVMEREGGVDHDGNEVYIIWCCGGIVQGQVTRGSYDEVIARGIKEVGR